MAVDGIGVVSGLLTILSFGLDQFGGSSGAHTHVRIGAALNGATPPDGGDGISGADGTVSQIRTLNAQQQILGLSGEVHANSGDPADVDISQENSNQAEFIEIHSSNDAICLAYVSVTWVDSMKWAWVGDFGQACGLKWYYSDITFGTEREGQGHKTLCTWLDADNTVTGEDGTTAGAIILDIAQFGDISKDGQDPSSVCGFPTFRAYTDRDATSPIFKRNAIRGSSEARAPAPVDPRLVITKEPSHSATELCEHDNSKGPDLVNLVEGKYCNMETREVLPVCGDGIDAGCFDVDNKAVVSKSKKRSAKSYSDVLEWGN